MQRPKIGEHEGYLRLTWTGLGYFQEPLVTLNGNSISELFDGLHGKWVRIKVEVLDEGDKT